MRPPAPHFARAPVAVSPRWSSGPTSRNPTAWAPVLDTTLADLEDYRRTIRLRNRAIEIWLARIDEIRGLFAELVPRPNSRRDRTRRPTRPACPRPASPLRWIPSRGGARIVTTSLDFPSTRLPVARPGAARLRGHRGRLAPTAIANAGGTGWVAAIDEARRDRRGLAGRVQQRRACWPRPARVNRRRARRRRDSSCSDAYQAAGIVPIDVRLARRRRRESPAPTSGCTAASNGLAFAYVRLRALAERLTPAYPGWFSHGPTWLDFDPVYTPAPGGAPVRAGARPRSRRLYAARAGVRFALDVGRGGDPRARSLELADHLIAGRRRARDPARHAHAIAPERAGRGVPRRSGDPRPGRRAAARAGDRRRHPAGGPGSGCRSIRANLHDEVDRVLAELRRHA